MDRRKFLIGFVGGLAAAPALIAMASSVEAAPLPEALPAGASAPTEADLGTVETDWAQAPRRVARRTSRRVTRRRY
jgi:hypothetical protein